MNAKKIFRLGTAVKITTSLSIKTPSSVTITIEDPTDSPKITDVNMAKEADYIYSYIYQSASTDQDGDYVITIKAVSSGYTALTQDIFTLIKQD